MQVIKTRFREGINWFLDYLASEKFGAWLCQVVIAHVYIALQVLAVAAMFVLICLIFIGIKTGATWLWHLAF